jgi:hypothetical protein
MIILFSRDRYQKTPFNEKASRFIRYTALASIRRNIQFSEVVSSSCPKITHLFLKEFVKTKTILHQTQSSRYLISFSDENSTQAGCRCRHCFPLPKPCRIFPRCDVNNEKSDVMTSDRSERRLLYPHA